MYIRLHITEELLTLQHQNHQDFQRPDAAGIFRYFIIYFYLLGKFSTIIL